uniref:Uncharacterized protein n=1 Tax=Panagrolaimus superbus TaxID=310955 RepID=A0A914XZF8_9BILA
MTTSSTSSASIGTNTIHSSFNKNNNPLKTIKVSTTTPSTNLNSRFEKRNSTKEEREESEAKIVSPLPPEIAKQITDQLRNAGLGKAPTSMIPSAAAAAATTTASTTVVAGLQKPKLHSQSSCSSPIRSGIPQSAYSLKDLRKPSATISSRSRKDSAESARKANSSNRKSRRNSADSAKSSTIIASTNSNSAAVITTDKTTLLPSPYSKITTAKSPLNGAYSSGHGSDETNSNPGQPPHPTTTTTCPSSTTTLLPRPIPSSGGGASKIPSGNSLLMGNKNRPRNRESFSASSGYESADYGKYRNAAITSPEIISNDTRLKVSIFIHCFGKV